MALQKVACIGDSVTYGAGIQNREKNSYPSQLQVLLGKNYQVENFGRNGSTLLTKGHLPYVKTKEYQNAIALKADIVIIHLGLNDTDPRNWPNYHNDFIKDYTALIASFKKSNPKTKVFICRMSPITTGHPRFASSTRDWYQQIQKQIELISTGQHIPLIDFEAILYDKTQLLPDNIHPNQEGAALIAQEVHAQITGDFGDLQVSELYGNHMILPRRENLALHGRANRNSIITVQLANQTKKVRTSFSGHWAVTFPPMEAGGPYTLEIASKSRNKTPKILTFKDLYLGEVWLCSGQSNMHFRLSNCIEKAELIAKAKENPRIHHFNMQGRWDTTQSVWSQDALQETNHLKYYKNNGWQVADESNILSQSAIAYAFAQKLHDELDIPIGIIHNAIGGSPIQSWIDRKSIEKHKPQLFHQWRRSDYFQAWVRQRASHNIKASKNPLQRHPYETSYLYAAGIAPLQAYPITGVIWYQGESNEDNIPLHEELFPLLIDSWRATWGKDFPFYYVQLSSLNRPSWPLFRDSQRRLMTCRPKLGMAVCSDLGDAKDVHPRRKKAVGERLAAWRLHDAYDKKIIPSGPLFKKINIKKNKAILSFDFAQGLRIADGKSVRGFEIADQSGIFKEAKARIKGMRVEVYHPNVRKPVYVRYGWKAFSDANLINKAGLPASTFQSANLF